MRNRILCLTLISAMMMNLLVGLSINTAYAKEEEATSLSGVKQVRVRSYKETKLRVKWKRVTSADGYQIFQYKPKEKKFVRVATVGKEATSWISGNTKTEKTYKVRAFKKVAGKKIYSKFSYEVRAIPYKKNAKKVNAGKIRLNRYYKRLSYYETLQLKTKVSPSKYAKNKKAKVYDSSVRWYASNPAVATVSEDGFVTPTGIPGTCFIYARAHNGNFTYRARIKVVNYARPKKFNDVEYTQDDVANLLTNYSEELMTIAEFYERKWAENDKESEIGAIYLNDARTDLVVKNSKLEYKPIYEELFDVIDSYPGDLMIFITNYYIRFDLSDNNYYISLAFLFKEPNYFEETSRNFYVAPRWEYETYRYA